MKNAVYPTMSSQLYNFGNVNNDGLQMLNSDVSLSVYGNNFFHESQLTNDQLLGSFSPLSTIEIPSSLGYLTLPGLLPISDASTSDCSGSITTSTIDAMYANFTTQQQPLYDLFPDQTYPLANERKRTITTSDIGPMLGEFATDEESNKKQKNVMPVEEIRRPHSQYFCEKGLLEQTREKQLQSEEKRLLEQTKAKQQLYFCEKGLLEQTRKKRRQTEEKGLLKQTKAKQQQLKDMQVQNMQQQIRVKKSQKIGDKITALQKLVSPYGKTDTASVLKEAAGHIKVLHNQIQMLTNPYFRSDLLIYHRQHYLQDGTGETNNELRKRGLCLAPVSFTHKIIKEAKP